MWGIFCFRTRPAAPPSLSGAPRLQQRAGKDPAALDGAQRRHRGATSSHSWPGVRAGPRARHPARYRSLWRRGRGRPPPPPPAGTIPSLLCEQALKVFREPAGRRDLTPAHFETGTAAPLHQSVGAGHGLRGSLAEIRETKACSSRRSPCPGGRCALFTAGIGAAAAGISAISSMAKVATGFIISVCASQHSRSRTAPIRSGIGRSPSGSRRAVLAHRRAEAPGLHIARWARTDLRLRQRLRSRGRERARTMFANALAPAPRRRAWVASRHSRGCSPRLRFFAVRA
jgi:hypothetical protein